MYSKCVLGYSMLLNMVSGAISFLKVIVRRERQMAQLRKGLKDTRVLVMLKERPELTSALFPRSAEAELEPEVTCRAYRPCTGLAWSCFYNSCSLSDDNRTDCVARTRQRWRGRNWWLLQCGCLLAAVHQLRWEIATALCLTYSHTQTHTNLKQNVFFCCLFLSFILRTAAANWVLDGVGGAAGRAVRQCWPGCHLPDSFYLFHHIENPNRMWVLQGFLF